MGSCCSRSRGNPTNSSSGGSDPVKTRLVTISRVLGDNLKQKDSSGTEGEGDLKGSTRHLKPESERGRLNRDINRVREELTEL